MAFWSTDMTTEDGALGAAGQGGVACFASAVLTVIGTVFVGALQMQGPQAMFVLGFAGVELLVFLVAGWRLRSGKGLIWGSAAAALLLLELVTKLAVLMIGIGLLLNAILLIVTVNGVRGAWALRKGLPDAEAEAEIFS
jgi:hypothetical protein